MLKLCLFSPVKGVVVKEGKPISGAIVERTCEWRTKEVDRAVTSELGEFSFPGIYSWLGVVQLIPHEPIIYQSLEIMHEGVTYNAWNMVKHDYGEYEELSIASDRGLLPSLDGKPINLYCELTKEPTNHGGVWGYGGLAELRQEQS